MTLHGRGPAGLFATLGQTAMVMDLGIADANLVGGDGAENLGLLAGRTYGGDVIRCYATGRLSAGRESVALGGLIGWNRAFVMDCYTRSDLFCGEKSSHLGGLAGYCDYSSSMIQRSYAAGTVVVMDPNETCGGLLGATPRAKTMWTSYFLAPSDGGGPDNGLGVPLTDAEMKRQESFTKWDFKETWKICAGLDYPRLRWEGGSYQ